MIDYEKGLQRLGNAQESDPRECCFGFFLQDIGNSSLPGYFYWYRTEKGLLKAIKNDLVCLYQPHADEVKDIKESISNIVDNYSGMPKFGEELRKLLDEFVDVWGSSMEFLGTFKQLCESTRKWESEVRMQYREHVIEDADEENAKDPSDEELRCPIRNDEVDGFVEYICDFRGG